VNKIVDIFNKGERFESSRIQNKDNLKLKFDYLFNISHKVLDEAHLHILQNGENDY
jgi:hypothetical protein